MYILLDELADEFYLTKQYLSKYIRQKTGETFGEVVQNIRMNKACERLKDTNLIVEGVAKKVEYLTVEYINRLSKKRFKVTPMERRNGRQGGNATKLS